MNAIQKLLGTDREFVCSLVARSPAVLALTSGLWESRLQEHRKVRLIVLVSVLLQKYILCGFAVWCFTLCVVCSLVVVIP